MNPDFTIGNKPIVQGGKPFVIAELSGNHGQDLDIAMEMVKQAAMAGVDAIKLQTYTADSMTLDSDRESFRINEEDSLWYGEKLHGLYAKASTPYEWHKQLFDYAKSLGLVAFSSPFDLDAVDFLESLDVPCYKVASFELTDLPLVRKIARTGKPMIMSTGMASVEEIEEALHCAAEEGNSNVVLLKCTSTYPAAITDTNLNTIADMHARFCCGVGLSDHTLGIGAAVASVALGACVIEKHFVLSRDNEKAVDAAFSLEPAELKMLASECESAWQALGNIVYGGTQNEEKAKQYRRSIFAFQDVKQGQILDASNLKIVRPAHGLAPKYWDQVIGRVAKTDISAGTPMAWELFE